MIWKMLYLQLWHLSPIDYISFQFSNMLNFNQQMSNITTGGQNIERRTSNIELHIADYCIRLKKAIGKLL